MLRIPRAFMNWLWLPAYRSGRILTFGVKEVPEHLAAYSPVVPN